MPLAHPNGFFKFSLLLIDNDQPPTHGDEVRVHLERRATDFDGFIVLARVVKRSPGKRSVSNRERVELVCALHLLKGILSATKHCQVDPIPGVRSGVTRVEFEGAMELPLGGGCVPVVGELRPRRGWCGLLAVCCQSPELSARRPSPWGRPQCHRKSPTRRRPPPARRMPEHSGALSAALAQNTGFLARSPLWSTCCCRRCLSNISRVLPGRPVVP